ncbi:MAG: permease-like cell division protein FtsX [Solirubrobacterales bacterium]
MSRIFFFIAEAFRALRRSASPSLAAIVTVVMTTLLLGVFIPVIKASSTTTEHVQSQLALYVYMNADATKKQALAAQKKIDKIQGVKRTDFVTPADGLKKLKENVGESEIGQGITQLQGKNPLPYSIVVHPDNANDLPAIQSAISPDTKNAKPISPAIDVVNNGQKTASAIRTVTNAVKVMLTVIAILLLIVSLLLIANTIRLSIYARRREVEVMRLVGATNWFIRWPFVIEGLIVGLAGAAIAVAMLWIGKLTIIDPLAKNFELIDKFQTVGFVPLIIVLLGASIVVSMLGSGIVLRRFLRV